MELKEEKKDQVTIYRFAGRLDATTSNEVFERFSKVIDAGNRALVFDYTELPYISSAGLRTLLLVIRKLNAQGGKLAIFGHNDSIKQIFAVSGFTSLFSFAQNEEEALALVRK